MFLRGVGCGVCAGLSEVYVPFQSRLSLDMYKVAVRYVASILRQELAGLN
jgi:hypothetical protein